jgi:hypothetical protein
LVSSVEHCNVCPLRLQVAPWYLQLNIVMSVLCGFIPWYFRLPLGLFKRLLWLLGDNLLLNYKSVFLKGTTMVDQDL